jgi:hypothetical protein
MANNNKTKPAYDTVIVVSGTLFGILFSFGYSNFNLWIYLPLCVLIIYVAGYFSLYVYYLSDDVIIKQYLLRPIYSLKKVSISNLDYIELRRKDGLKQLPLVVFWRKDSAQTSKKFLINSYFFNRNDLGFLSELASKGVKFKVNIDSKFKKDIRAVNDLLKYNSKSL